MDFNIILMWIKKNIWYIGIGILSVLIIIIFLILLLHKKNKEEIRYIEVVQ